MNSSHLSWVIFNKRQKSSTGFSEIHANTCVRRHFLPNIDLPFQAMFTLAVFAHRAKNVKVIPKRLMFFFEGLGSRVLLTKTAKCQFGVRLFLFSETHILCIRLKAWTLGRVPAFRHSSGRSSGRKNMRPKHIIGAYFVFSAGTARTFTSN